MGVPACLQTWERKNDPYLAEHASWLKIRNQNYSQWVGHEELPQASATPIQTCDSGIAAWRHVGRVIRFLGRQHFLQTSGNFGRAKPSDRGFSGSRDASTCSYSVDPCQFEAAAETSQLLSLFVPTERLLITGFQGIALHALLKG